MLLFLLEWADQPGVFPKRSVAYINFLSVSTVLRNLRGLPPCSLHRQLRRYLYSGWFSQSPKWGLGGGSLLSDLTGTESTHIPQLEWQSRPSSGEIAQQLQQVQGSGRTKAKPWEEALAKWNAVCRLWHPNAGLCMAVCALWVQAPATISTRSTLKGSFLWVLIYSLGSTDCGGHRILQNVKPTLI